LLIYCPSVSNGINSILAGNLKWEIQVRKKYPDSHPSAIAKGGYWLWKEEGREREREL
jgi:hypothetical protein